MVRYVQKDASELWDELKARIPKLKSGTFIGLELVEFETIEPLTDTELAEMEKFTGKKWRRE